MNTNNGGPAFPLSESANGQFPAQVGMTLRDYFAAKTLEGGLAHKHFADGFTFQERAEWCYQQADAMLKARES